MTQYTTTTKTYTTLEEVKALVRRREKKLAACRANRDLHDKIVDAINDLHDAELAVEEWDGEIGSPILDEPESQSDQKEFNGVMHRFDAKYGWVKV